MNFTIHGSTIKFYKSMTIDGLSEWFWIESDTYGLGYTSRDWPEHKAKILKHVPERRTCIQAGGHQGMYARLLSFMFQTVYTFEPDPVSFYALSLNNPSENVLRFQAALGEKSKMITLDRGPPNNAGESRVSRDPIQGYIPMMAIDSFTWENGVDLIFLDVEGYENEVLNGAVNTINKFHPAVIVEAPDERLIKGIASQGYGPPIRYANDAMFVYEKKDD